jgi:hypothetical protein
MTDRGGAQVLAGAREALARPIGFADLLARLAGRDRQNAERRAAALDATPFADRARAWRRLACALMTLAPAARFAGRTGVEFFVPDGRYRMQVFALEDVQDGDLTVYCPDVLAEAAAAGVLSPTGRPDPDGYAAAATGEPLRVEPLDGTAASPDPHVKNLTNWKRKALRVTLPPSPSAAQVEAVELLCAVAARHFVPPPPPAAAPAGGT